MTAGQTLSTDALNEPAPARRGPGLKILIAGGGIGGLSTALALAKVGIASHVLEGRPAYAEEGAGIQIGPNGMRVLADIGAASHLLTSATRPDALRVMDGRDGRELARLPLGSWIEARHGAPYAVAHRADLHGALTRRVREEPLVRLSMASAVVGVASGRDGVEVRLENGVLVAGDALIGADGLWSRVRTCHFHTPAPRYSGKSAVRAVVPIGKVPRELAGTVTHIWMSPGAHVVHYPVRAGHELAIVVVTDDPNASDSWATDVLPTSVQSRAVGLPLPLRELLAAPTQWRKWSLFERTWSSTWVKGRVALLGDAAHPVLPFLASGGVLAIEDAAVLARVVAGRPTDMAAALNAYGQIRRRRALDIERASRRNGRVYHLDGLVAAARNRALAALSPETLIGRYDWLYGWRPD